MSKEHYKKYNRLTWHRKERRKGEHPVPTKEIIRRMDEKQFFGEEDE